MMTPEPTLADDTEALAAALVCAHATGTRVACAGLPVPADASRAMAVQALVQGRLGLAVGGWKVALGPEQVPIAAPLLDLHTASSKIDLFPGCVIEVELAVRLGRNLPPRKTGAYERSDILAAIESVVLGIEVIGGRFDDAANVPFLSFLADHLGNRGYVVGEALPVSTLDMLADMTCAASLNGDSIHCAPAIHPAGDPLLPLLAYANRQSDGVGGLQAGQIVTTGSLCGVLPIRAAGRLKARLDQIATVSVDFVARSPA
ncbi:fumarylacetoacetate hydrolase family protein [Bosea vaviloviae]|uniref:fumarylacetoacetate hydrolase family protein n=1 Tax=Bosea vaviloviae TaxID=1526658 RepID=UPI0011DF07D8|nr:fumarylacetoacetate hydrolase family protein [Bosea vaviloviae]